MEQVRFLKEYQDLEASENVFKKMLRGLPQAAILKKLKLEIETEQESLKAGKEGLKGLEKIVKELEFETEDRQIKANQIEDRVFGGHTSNIKELESLNLQQQGLKEEISQLEDKILALYEEIENQRKELSKKNKQLKESKEKFKALLEDYRQQQANINSKLQALPTTLQSLSDKIDSKLLSEYNDKKEKYGNKVIVGIKQQTCQGCHMAVSFEVIKKIKLGTEITYCDKCGRILLRIAD